MPFTGRKRIKKGLTLVEILVVILIIAILIVALIPRVTASLDKAKETQIRTDFRNFSLAAESVLREYAGFSGVPLISKNGKTLKTIGEQFWNVGVNVEEDADINISEEETYDAAVTQSFIKAINRYLESSYQFGDAPGSASFGRSAATDPWKKAYEIYFVSRNVEDNTIDPILNTDKIYITCNGKTQDLRYPDYMLLCEYYNGEVRTATSGFGDAIPAYYATFAFASPSNNKQYILLSSLFTSTVGGSGQIYDDGDGSTIFNMGTNINNTRLFITDKDDLPAGLEAKPADE